MLLAIGLIVLGIVLLVLGGEILLRGAVGLASLLKMTPAVIGLTVVAAGTSVPELAVSMTASFQGSNDITIGNVVGSNIFNITFILGLCALIRPLAIGGNTIKLEYPVLALVTLMALAICDHGSIHRLDGALFLAVYVGFTAYLVSLVRDQMNRTEIAEYQEEVQELAEVAHRPPRWTFSIAFVVLGSLLLAGGAHATVTGAVEIATLLGMSERIVALTIVSAGTGLPEVVTSVVSSFRGRNDVAIGNVIGSNLFNILIILGFSSVIRPLDVHPLIVASDGWWMVGVTFGLFPLLFTGRRIVRLEGILLLAAYAAYLANLLLRPES